ncbi:hypothetical protein [Thiocapsa sp. N5-Cardenillas]|uniref:hypothetical protein n=1 Tax=Thiocapsa sp. N5-Cardenillas TaxID=3137397 RepID=UPI0035B204C8
MSWLSSFLHPDRGYKAAGDQMQQFYNQAQGYQQPYNQQGQAAGQNLNTAQQALMDPVALQDQWSNAYQTSDYAKNLQAQAQQGGLDAASSMGLMGSTPALQAIQGGTAQIGNADRQQYLNDLMQKYQAGIGVNQNMYGIGAQSAGQMGQNAMNQGQNMGAAAFGQQNAPGNMLANLFGAAGNLGTSYLTGGMGTGGMGRGMWSPTGGN